MTKSLNQAFIKAYSKDEQSRAVQNATSTAATPAKPEADNLIMRFDTATVEVAQPNLARTEKVDRVAGNRVASVGPPALKLSRARGQVKLRHAEVMYSEPETTAEDLRDSIASQMLQAGMWQDQSVDTFLGSFPAISQVSEATATPNQSHSAPPAPQATAPQARMPDAPISVAPEAPPAAMPPVAPPVVQAPVAAAPQAPAPQVAAAPQAAAPEPQVIAPAASIELPSLESLAEQILAQRSERSAPAASAAPQETATMAPLANAPSPSPAEAPSAATAEIPELTAPDAPAISDRGGPQYERTVRYRTRSTRPAIDRDGGIFRLDRPSYAATQPIDSQESSLGSEASVVEALSQTSIDVASPEPATSSRPAAEIPAVVVHQSTSHAPHADSLPPAANNFVESKPAVEANPVPHNQPAASETNHRMDSASSLGGVPRPDPAAAKDTSDVEQKLRAAKSRTFNPVWEVDNLHWPHICFDLMEQSGSAMATVAQNLVTACEEGLQLLAVTSPKGGEGRTTIACCLAMLAGSRGLKVAIVDADLESPSLSHQTNLDVDQDWKSAVESQIPLEEVAVHAIDDQVTIVPLLQPIGHSEMSTDDNRIAAMLQELTEGFDLVIADMGHMNSPRSLIPTMGEHGIISAVVAVVDRRETSPEHLDSCIRRIRQSGVVSIGLVENFAA